MDGIEGIDIVFRCNSEDRAKEIMLTIGDSCIQDAACVRVVVFDAGVINAPAVATLTRLATQQTISFLDHLADVG